MKIKVFRISLAVVASLVVSDLSKAADPILKRPDVLVEMLASKNKGTTEQHYLPRDYDKQAQVPVYLAIQQLLQEGEAAFDVLIEHSDDQRVSFVYHAPDGEYDRSVGQVSQMIIRRSVYCYEDLDRFGIVTSAEWRRDPWELSDQKQTLKQWWEANRATPLWKLQVASIDDQTKLMRELNYETAQPNHPNAKKPPKDEFERRRDENLKRLIALKTAIASMEEAYRPKTLDARFATMAGLPWVRDW